MGVSIGALEGLEARFKAILSRLETLEQQVSAPSVADRLAQRQAAILARITALEQAAGLVAPANDVQDIPAVLPGESDIYKQQHRELVERGVRGFRFVRVPGPYYERPLEFRRDRVGADSIDHLCKTMVMENTRAPEHITDCSNPKLSKYYMVIVQYTAVINAEKLRAFVQKVANEVEALGKSKFNMRMAAEAASEALTGHGHNSVTPICSKTRMPIILSHHIADLSGLFYLGAGETDLKVGMPSSEFIKGFANVPVYVVDCTNS